MTCDMKREEGFAFWLDSPSQPALFTTPAITITTSTRTTTAVLLLLLFSFCPYDTKSSSDQFNSLRSFVRPSQRFVFAFFAFGLVSLVAFSFLLFTLSTIISVSLCHHASKHACFVCGCVMNAIDWHRCRPRRIAITNTNTNTSKIVFFLGFFLWG